MSLGLLAAVAAGYFLGGVPTAALVARLRGRNVFELGSGNMGAMNVARNLGAGFGAVVLAGDVGKGALAVLLGGGMAGAAGPADPLPMALGAGVGAVAGHAWSPYVRFRGGKGLATAFGATLPVAPVAGGYGALSLIALTLLLRRHPNVAAILALALYPWLTVAVLLRGGLAPERAFAIGTAAGLVALVSIAKHLRAIRSARGGASDHGGGRDLR